MAEAQALNLALQAFGNLLSNLRRATREHCRKLFTTNTPELITAAQNCLAGISNALQHIVAFLMPVGVVDLLEVIDVEQQER
ncbi:hypothetical protein D3C85_1783670 [compost metagenome]